MKLKYNEFLWNIIFLKAARPRVKVKGQGPLNSITMSNVLKFMRLTETSKHVEDKFKDKRLWKKPWIDFDYNSIATFVYVIIILSNYIIVFFVGQTTKT